MSLLKDQAHRKMNETIELQDRLIKTQTETIVLYRELNKNDELIISEYKTLCDKQAAMIAELAKKLCKYEESNQESNKDLDNAPLGF